MAKWPWLEQICQGTRAKSEGNEGQNLETTEYYTGMTCEGIMPIMAFDADNF